MSDEDNIEEFIDYTKRNSPRQPIGFWTLNWADHLKNRINLQSKHYPNEFAEQARKQEEFGKRHNKSFEEEITDYEQKDYNSFLHNLSKEKLSVINQYFQISDTYQQKLDSHQKAQIEKIVFELFSQYTPSSISIEYYDDKDNPIRYDALLMYYENAIAIAIEYNLNVNEYRQKIIDFLPFCYKDQQAVILGFLGYVDVKEWVKLKEWYLAKQDHLFYEQTIGNFLQHLHPYYEDKKELIIFLSNQAIKNDRLSYYMVENILRIFEELGRWHYIKEVFTYFKNVQVFEHEGTHKFTREYEIALEANQLLVIREEKDAVEWRIQQFKKAIYELELNPRNSSRWVKPIEDVPEVLFNISDIRFKDDMLNLLEHSFEVLLKKNTYQDYSKKVWRIVIAYFKKQKNKEDLEKYLKDIEKVASQEKFNSMIHMFRPYQESLKQEYLTYLSSTQVFSESMSIFQNLENVKSKILKPNKVKAFISYSHREKDKALKEKILSNFGSLQRKFEFEIWDDSQIKAGQEWKKEIIDNLNDADIIFLFISSDFINSNFIWEEELSRAIERHEAGTATVIPIILRPCLWQEFDFSKLQVLPSAAKPVTKWEDEDDAMLDIVQGVKEILEDRLK